MNPSPLPSRPLLSSLLWRSQLWISLLIMLPVAALATSVQIQLIDTRPSSFYNGWPEPGQTVGGHLPGAVNLAASWLLLLSDRELADLLALGITHDRQVVLYGRDTMAAARAAQLMLYAGVEDVRLLDGGWQAWEAADEAQESGWRQPVAAADFGAVVPDRPELVIDTPQARDYLARPDHALVSIRTQAEHRGQTSGYSYIEQAGDIPGALWGQAGDTARDMAFYRNPDNTMRAAPELIARWRSQGIHQRLKLAFYCGTGWRASEAFFYAWIMGWQQIAVYDGGWLEWSRQAEVTPDPASLPVSAPVAEPVNGQELPSQPLPVTH